MQKTLLSQTRLSPLSETFAGGEQARAATQSLAPFRPFSSLPRRPLLDLLGQQLVRQVLSAAARNLRHNANRARPSTVDRQAHASTRAQCSEGKGEGLEGPTGESCFLGWVGLLGLGWVVPRKVG